MESLKNFVIEQSIMMLFFAAICVPVVILAQTSEPSQEEFESRREYELTLPPLVMTQWENYWVEFRKGQYRVCGIDQTLTVNCGEYHAP